MEKPCRFEGGEYCQITINWGISVGRIRAFLERADKAPGTPGRCFREGAQGSPRGGRAGQGRAEASFRRAAAQGGDPQGDQHGHADPRICPGHPAGARADPRTDDHGARVRPGDDHGRRTSRRESLDYLYGVGGLFDDTDHGSRITASRSPRTTTSWSRSTTQGSVAISQDPLAMGLNPANRILHDFHPGPFVVCPMFAKDRIIGILGVDRRDRTIPRRRATRNTCRSSPTTSPRHSNANGLQTWQASKKLRRGYRRRRRS